RELREILRLFAHGPGGQPAHLTVVCRSLTLQPHGFPLPLRVAGSGRDQRAMAHLRAADDLIAGIAAAGAGRSRRRRLGEGLRNLLRLRLRECCADAQAKGEGTSRSENQTHVEPPVLDDYRVSARTCWLTRDFASS